GNPARRAHVVFEHAELAGLRVAHEIDPADVRMNSARDLHSDHLAPEMGAGIDERARNLPVPENALLAVDVLQEKIQRYHALRKPLVDALPLRVRQDARDQIEGEQPLGAAAVAVYRERDPLDQEREVGKLPPLLELTGGHRRKLLKEFGVLRAGLARRREHLVIKTARVIALEKAAIHHWRRHCPHRGILPTAICGAPTERLDATHQRFRGLRRHAGDSRASIMVSLKAWHLSGYRVYQDLAEHGLSVDLLAVRYLRVPHLPPRENR